MDDFAALYGRPAAIRASAPGRVNLMGEHTDYNGGFVLPTAIPQRTRVALAPRSDTTARVASREQGGASAARDYQVGNETRGGDWLDYVQGITAVLVETGWTPRGFEAWIASDVPLGSGLSSSAALEVALLRALREAFALPLDDVQLALLAHRAEVEFVGARVGVMDQFAASLVDDRTALFLDTRELSFEHVPLLLDAELVVIDSGVAHAHAAGDYNTRRGECERACALLGLKQLRDLGTDDLDRVAALPPPLDRRARHVIAENTRVLAAVAALRAADPATLGELFYASHASQRDDYAVSVPETDRLVELARREPDVYGARLTGGGFGGSVVMLARAGRGRAAAERIVAAAASCPSAVPAVLVPAPKG